MIREKGVLESEGHRVFSCSSFLTFSTPDRHGPVLCTGLHFLPTELHCPLLGPAEPLQPADGESRGCFGGVQVRGQGEGILLGLGLVGAGLLLSGRVSGESRSRNKAVGCLGMPGELEDSMLSPSMGQQLVDSIRTLRN